ncbi:MAG TPA: T9SS type A sorting domain-containing protein [Bacteroidia bacterium]|nr:T9SS type A sorting domain-containing protein [Bacteroidia bacterium]
MKKITSICSAILIGSIMLASVNSFAKGTKAADKGKNAENAAVAGANFCTVFATVLRQTNNNCYGQANGNVVIYALGGTSPYTYSWSPSVGSNFALDTVELAGGMAAGSYTCTVTDANSCSYSLTVTITSPPQLTLATTTSTNDICNGAATGSAMVTAGGGTPSYTYAWKPAVSTTTSASNLSAGNYVVTVTDSLKCTAKDTVKITQPVPIATTTAVVLSSCKATNGMASVSASAGVAPYTYSWSPGGQTKDTATNLGPASYTCTVTDANGCHVAATAIVSDSSTLKAVMTNEANEKCYGEAIGLASFSVSGGTGLTDTYSWSPSGSTTTAASGLVAGTYTFTVTDSVGCQAVSTVNITQPNALRDSMANVRQVLCYGAATGRTTAGVTGGTTPYTYAWSTGATTSNLTNVAAGSYTVVVTDANGCKDSTNITLTQPATAVADSNQLATIKCYGGSATATAFAYGGVKPYTYAWSGGSTNTTNTATLTAGTYIVTIRDSNKCRLRDTIVVNQPPTFISSTTVTGMDTSISTCVGAASVQLVGTQSKYTFSWSPSGGSGDTASSLCAGTYIATITDSTGCVEYDTVQILNYTGIQQYTNPQSIKVYPVPARDQINVSIIGNSFTPEYIGVYDVTGRLLVSVKAEANKSLYTINVSQLTEGTYFIKLSGNGEKVAKFTIAK